MGYDAFANLNALGLWSHSISEAAELVVLEMFYSGQLGELDPSYDFENMDIDSVSKEDLLTYLSPKIKEIERLLVRSVDSGKIDSEYIMRDLNDLININETYIEHSDLTSWAEMHGVEINDAFNDWEQTEAEILTYILKEIESLKKAKKIDTGVLWDIIHKNRSGKQKDLFSAWKKSQDEIIRLQNEIMSLSAGTPKNKPMSTNSRRTHQVIIAALCAKCKIDFNERGASRKIMIELEKIGVPIDDETIRKILKEIPDSLEARQR